MQGFLIGVILYPGGILRFALLGVHLHKPIVVEGYLQTV